MSTKTYARLFAGLFTALLALSITHHDIALIKTQAMITGIFFGNLLVLHDQEQAKKRGDQ